MKIASITLFFKKLRRVPMKITLYTLQFWTYWVSYFILPAHG